MEQHAGGNSEKFLRKIFQAGDHIFSERMGNIYHHHGIYVGDSMVIHLRRKSSRRNYCLKCRYIPPLRCGRILSCFDCFRDSQMCFIIRYRTPVLWENLDEDIRRMLRPGKAIQGYNSEQVYLELFWGEELYCHKKISKNESCRYELEDKYKLSRFSTSKSADKVMKTALEDDSGFKRYNLLMNNCEDFAVLCKTNKVVSTQVEKWLTKRGYKAAKAYTCFASGRIFRTNSMEG